MKWEKIAIRDIAKIHYGKALKSQDRVESGSIPVYGSSGQVGNHIGALVKHPTLIIGRKGSVGSVTYSEQGGWPIDTVFYTEFLEPQKVSLRYFFYALRQAHLDRWTITTSIPGLNRDDLYATKIPLPPLEEQRRIAAILDKADEVRRKRQEAIRLTEELLRSLFLDMFGDPVTNPKGWTTKQFKKVIINHDSKRVPLKESDRDQRHGTYPYYGSVGIIDYIDDYLFDGEYLLISEDGKHLESRNRPICCIASGKFWVNNHAHVLSQKEVDLYFLSFFIELSQIRKFVTGIDQFKLNRSNLDRIPVFVPPMHLQKRFRDLCHKNQSLLSRFSTNVEHDLFNSLLQRAFRGEL